MSKEELSQECPLERRVMELKIGFYMNYQYLDQLQNVLLQKCSEINGGREGEAQIRYQTSNRSWTTEIAWSL